jgi:hypothetical protein
MLHHYSIHKPLHPFTAYCTYSSPSQVNPSSSIIVRRQYHDCPCTCHSLLQRVDDINLGNRSQHAPSSLPKHPLSLFLAFSILHLPTPCDTSQIDTPSSAGRLLTLPPDSTTTIHRSTHNNSHQHAFSSRHRRSHHGAVRPTHFDSLSCFCCSHFSCSSSGIFVLLDGDH